MYMRARLAATAVLVLALAACGSSVASGPASTAAGPGGGAATTPPAGPATGAPATGAPATGSAAIDLSGVDACALVPEGTVEALTGETGFVTDDSASGSTSPSCFWAVPRPGIPQYLEVRISQRTKSLADYALNVNGVACPGATVAGVGAEAKGGVCTTPQRKVFLIAMDRGVAVEVIVNEPKSALDPAGLADVVNDVIASLE
jgi:hypothetical protein